MYIIFGDNVVEALKENYTILELEEITRDSVTARAYCVVPGDKISLFELPDLENNKKLHTDFVRAYENKNYNYCVQAAEYLMGKFGGELDSFYTEILNRIDKQTV